MRFDTILFLTKSSSFDRLFPNQDYLSGKGFGNLIALPLNKASWDNGNSCFINPETLLSIENQWEFLNIAKYSEIYRSYGLPTGTKVNWNCKN